MEAPQQVLRQLDAVDPDDDAAVAERRVELGPARRRTPSDRGRAARSSGSGGERRHDVGGGATPAPRQHASNAVGPALGVEAAGVVGGHAPEQLGGGGVGQRPQPVGRGEGRVAEVHERGGRGAPLAQQRRRRGTGGSPARARPRRRARLGGGVGERLVHARGRRPTPRRHGGRGGAGGRRRTGRGGRTTAWRCTPRRRRRGRSPGRWRGAGPEARRPRPTPPAAASRSPSDIAAAIHSGVGAADERRRARHEPAGAAPGHERAVVVRRERQRAPVRDEDDGRDGSGAGRTGGATMQSARCAVGGRSRQVPGDRHGARRSPPRSAGPRVGARVGLRRGADGRRRRGLPRRARRPEPHDRVTGPLGDPVGPAGGSTAARR